MINHSLWITCVLSLGLLLTTPAAGFLNVFIDQHEMVKLMGLDAELFYVRHGIVNNFALSFVVPVPEQVDDLTFSWQSLVDLPIRYSISIEYESQLGGLLTPHINVPVQGHVPMELSTFTIRLPCTGNVSEEVPVGIHLEIDGYPHFNHTKLTFKRNKICIKDESLLKTHNLTQESVVFKLIVFAFTFLLVSSVILVTCYCRGSLSSRHQTKGHEISPQTSYTIDESSSCSASSSLSSRTMTTMAKSTTSRHNHHHLHHHNLHQQPQVHSSGRHYDNVQGGFLQRPQSIAASCSSLYETIVESVNKFPMQTMHSNKTCGACCSMFAGDQNLYDGVTIAGLVLPPSAAAASNMHRDRRSMAVAGAAIYDQPEEPATIRWPAPPLFTIEDEQQRVKQNPLHCYNNTISHHHQQLQGLKHETRSNTTPGSRAGERVGGFEGNPFRAGLWNADVVSGSAECGDAGKESCNYYEPTTFVNQHL